MIGPALQGAQLISNLGRVAPWIISGASMIPGIPGAVNAAGRIFNQPAAPYNPGGGGMGGRRGTAGAGTYAKPTGSLRDYGTGYKEQELRAGAEAERFRPGAGFPGQQAPAERAFQAEKSRVAQLTAQDPELQRYERARQVAIGPGATPEQVQSAEDIGMQMWAKANPALAAKVKPGQSGYDAIQGFMAGQAARQGLGYQTPQQITMTPPPGVNTPQGFPGVQSIQSAEAYTTQGLQLDPEMTKKFQSLLNQSKQ